MKQQRTLEIPLEKIEEYTKLLQSGKSWHADYVRECLEDLLLTPKEAEGGIS